MDTKELEARLASVRSRGDVKALGAAIDEDPDLLAVALELARRRGREAEPDCGGKRLVRVLLARQEGARVHRNPIRRDGGFRCAHCGRDVEPGGARVRDHCPWCLRGLHVDRVPGDRAAECGGVFDPTGFDLKGRTGVVIAWKCRRCGATWSGRAHPTDRVPPSMRVEDIDPDGGPPPEDTGASQVAERARTLPLRVLEAIRGGLWARGQGVVVAVSGGVDSAVMLELLASTRGAHGGELVVASLDHGDQVDRVDHHRHGVAD